MMIAVSLNTCLCVLCVIATIRQWMLEYNIYCDVDQDNICYFIVVLSEYRRWRICLSGILELFERSSEAPKLYVYPQEDPDLDNLLSRWCLLWVNTIGHQLPRGSCLVFHVMVVFGTVSDFPYICTMSEVTWTAWPDFAGLDMSGVGAVPRAAWTREVWLISARAGDGHAWACALRWYHAVTWLGAAARVRGQMDDISIFNLI